MSRVNLIPQARLSRQAAHRRSRAWGKFLRIYCILLAVACGLTLLPAHAAGPSLDSSISRLDRRIKSASVQNETLNKQIAALTKQLSDAAAVGNHPDWSALLSALARACTPEPGSASNTNVVLDTFDFSIIKPVEAKPKDSATPAPKGPTPPKPRETFLIKISGLSADPAGAVQFAGRLERLGLFDRVDLKAHAQPLGQMHTARFEIEMSVLNVPSTGAAK